MKPSRTSVLRLACFWSVLAVAVAGCGGTGDVTGKVTYNGKPLKGGTVSFISADNGRSFASSLSEDGSYSVPGMQSGTYKVCVETESANVERGMAAAMRGGGQPSQSSARPGSQPKGPILPDDKHFKAPPEGSTGGNPVVAPGAMMKAAKERYVKIPTEYGSPETTKLEFKFSGGATTYPIDLK